MENKKSFITRLIIFIIFALIIPFVYLSARFDLFRNTKNISIWGVFAIILVIVVITLMIKYYLDGMKTKYSYFKQVLLGFIRIVVPCIIILVISIWAYYRQEWVMSQWKVFIEVLSVLTGCETVAIFVNPLPKWMFENNIDGYAQMADKIFHREQKTLDDVEEEEEE